MLVRAPICSSPLISERGFGLVGCTIEDTTGSQDKPLYDLSLAVERIAAAAQAARALGFPFILTARAHNLMYANPILDETINRLQAFERAGADVLFAPGLPDLVAACNLYRSIKTSEFYGGHQRKVLFGR